VQWVPGSWG